mmetsp:Transcript_39989/g.103485  ORF Transcript_39989/g.103485 Transcript_39989/m.103485 type:complete len:218 (+) Transcript_39989:577-1230(+)
MYENALYGPRATRPAHSKLPHAPRAAHSALAASARSQCASRPPEREPYPLGTHNWRWSGMWCPQLSTPAAHSTASAITCGEARSPRQPPFAACQRTSSSCSARHDRACRTRSASQPAAGARRRLAKKARADARAEQHVKKGAHGGVRMTDMGDIVFTLYPQSLEVEEEPFRGRVNKLKVVKGTLCLHTGVVATKEDTDLHLLSGPKCSKGMALPPYL